MPRNVDAVHAGKKAPRANLENKRLSHVIIGFIITLSLVLISIEWTSPQDLKADLNGSREIYYDIDETLLIPRDEPKPETKPELPPVKDILDIVPDDVEVPVVDFDPEVDRNTRYDIGFPNPEPEVLDDEPVQFFELKDQPKFNGGDPMVEFTRYIASRLIYPAIAAENGISGRVIVQFVIDQTGSLVDPVILRGVDPALDAEAIRVISSSPKWTPGKQRTRPVKVSYTFPINFVLQ